MIVFCPSVQRDIVKFHACHLISNPVWHLSKHKLHRANLHLYNVCRTANDIVAGIILAYSNSLAGRLSDMSVTQGYGNIGCFLGGTTATVLSGIALLVFSKFSDLGREDKIVTLKKGRK